MASGDHETLCWVVLAVIGMAVAKAWLDRPRRDAAGEEGFVGHPVARHAAPAAPPQVLQPVGRPREEAYWLFS